MCKRHSGNTELKLGHSNFYRNQYVMFERKPVIDPWWEKKKKVGIHVLHVLISSPGLGW